MKIAFLSANREKLPDAVIPLGVLYVMGTTPEHHEKVLWDLCFEDEPEALLREKLLAFQPDVVAFGMRNIQNNDYTDIETNLSYYADLMAIIRRHGTAQVVMGGGGFSVMPKELMERLRPDFGISGEGEEAFPRLIDALEHGTAFDDIGALFRFEDGEVVANPRGATFLDMNALPIPDRSLVDARYFEEYAIDSLQTKRGCVLKCDYCTYPLIEGARGRVREPARVADEMCGLLEQNAGVKHVFVVDSVFNLPLRHAKEVCRELIKREWRTPWTCYANPLGFDQELAELMAQARCAGMEIGSDSGCDDILLKLKKGFTTERIREMRRICEAARLRDCHTFILGTQGETMDHVHRTLDFIVDLDPFAAIVMVWTDDYEALDPVYARERLAFRNEIHAVLRDRRKQYPRWIIPPLGIHFDEMLFGYLRRLGLSGPLWQHIELAGGVHANV